MVYETRAIVSCGEASEILAQIKKHIPNDIEPQFLVVPQELLDELK